MKPGDVAEIAIWLTGEETEEQIRQFVDGSALDALNEAADRHHVLIGPMVFCVKRPGEDRVPPVPDHISGPDVRLLVGEALVYERPAGRGTVKRATGFVHDLTADDLATLRGLTRLAHRRSRPDEPALSDAECDVIIEAVGPDVAVATLRDGAAVQ